MQQEWRPLVDAARLAVLQALRQSRHAGVRLVGLYLRGSVAQGHALAHVSDLDLMVYVATPLPHGGHLPGSADERSDSDSLSEFAQDLQALRGELQSGHPCVTKVGALPILLALCLRSDVQHSVLRPWLVNKHATDNQVRAAHTLHKPKAAATQGFLACRDSFARRSSKPCPRPARAAAGG